MARSAVEAEATFASTSASALPAAPEEPCHLEVLEFLGVLELVLEVLEQVHAIEADYFNSRVLAASLACLRRNLGPLRENFKGGAH